MSLYTGLVSEISHMYNEASLSISMSTDAEGFDEVNYCEQFKNFNSSEYGE